MINKFAKPVEKHVIFIEPTDNYPKLEVTANIYDEPAMATDQHQIFSIVTICEESGKQFGILMYESTLEENEVKELFTNISADPLKFKR